jgi:hypothetical protein
LAKQFEFALLDEPLEPELLRILSNTQKYRTLLELEELLLLESETQ